MGTKMFRLFFFTITLLLAACSQPEEAVDPADKSGGLSGAKPDVPTAMPEVMDPGQAFLHINARKPNVKVLESGLQFEILKSGEGRSPDIGSSVVTHYHGTFVDGVVFDSSVERGQPAKFPVSGVISGWTQALQMMKEGDKWRLVLPPHLAYGERGRPGIPPHSVLVFELELLAVN